MQQRDSWLKIVSQLMNAPETRALAIAWTQKPADVVRPGDLVLATCVAVSSEPELFSARNDECMSECACVTERDMSKHYLTAVAHLTQRVSL